MGKRTPTPRKGVVLGATPSKGVVLRATPSKGVVLGATPSKGVVQGATPSKGLAPFRFYCISFVNFASNPLWLLCISVLLLIEWCYMYISEKLNTSLIITYSFNAC